VHAEEGRTEHSGQAEQSGEGGSGAFPDYGTTQHAHAQKKAKRSGQAKRSEGESPPPPPTTAIQLVCTPEKAKPSAAVRSSAAGKQGSGVSPGCFSETRRCANEAKRSDHAERSGKWVPLEYNINQRAAKV
jgi:hypothetical protein